ncbi:hypothetical protein [Mycolicibacterium neoaurum]|uniref:hypothetical protein n=1 Tax=Mycolicibacterium neoaurum TaxID=1795 RepID=UPI001F4D3063|nr:hypothetical protein [Mycolicibacterium neoaurum]
MRCDVESIDSHAKFDEATTRWRITDYSGDRIPARLLVMATGLPSTPKVRDIAGIDAFTGTGLHTTDWPEDGAGLTGKTVGVIGTVSSGTQIIPIIPD